MTGVKIFLEDWDLKKKLNLNIRNEEFHKSQVWHHLRWGDLGDCTIGPLDSDPSHRENYQLCVLPLECVCQDWVFSLADACAVDCMPWCTSGAWQQAHPGQQKTSNALSKDGKHNRLHNSPGQAWQQFPGPVDALRWTWLANRLCKDFFFCPSSVKLTPSQNYQNHSGNTLGAFFSTSESLRGH